MRALSHQIFPEKSYRGPKKSVNPCRTQIVGMSRYPVFYLTPSELGDLAPKKKVFYFRKVYTLGAIALKVNLKQRARNGKILQNFALSKIENRFSFHEKSIFFKSDKKSIKYKLNAIRNAANYRIAPKAR